MFKIKIEEQFNPKSEMVGKWFVKYDWDNDKPLFTDNEDEAGVFVVDFNDKMSLYGNLMALSDRFGYKGIPIPLNVAYNGLWLCVCGGLVALTVSIAPKPNRITAVDFQHVNRHNAKHVLCPVLCVKL